MMHAQLTIDPAMLSRLNPMLVVDDDPTFRERFALAMRDRGLDVLVAGNVDSARAVAESAVPRSAVLDLRMQGASGMALIEPLLAVRPGMAIVVLTGYGAIASATEAIRRGAKEYLTKPADVDQVLVALVGRDAVNEPPEKWMGATPSLAKLEWEHIQRVLSECSGNISRAARVLGIHRRSLQRKLARMAPPEE